MWDLTWEMGFELESFIKMLIRRWTHLGSSFRAGESSGVRSMGSAGQMDERCRECFQTDSETLLTSLSDRPQAHSLSISTRSAAYMADTRLFSTYVRMDYMMVQR